MSDEPSPYLHVAERIRERIVGGEFGSGDRLPSLTQLMADYGYSISVGQKAYGLLEQEGLVVAHHGRGYFVSSQDAPALLIRRQGDGVTGSWRSESATARATETVAARLEIEAGDPVMHTKYVHLLDGAPSYLMESWEPMAVTGGTLVVLPEAGPYGGIGVVARMAAIGIEAGPPVERVTARVLTRAEAQTLTTTPGTPALAIERTHHDAVTGRPVETADLLLPADRWATEYGDRPPRRG
ncbi:UTRA domain-containing protein [Kitasatospora albolonga]|uniref:GntR family transcriptional regulator n=1 Tax=Kitasatospora albolonga TaxID=68173 RepID=UPI0031ECD0F8